MSLHLFQLFSAEAKGLGYEHRIFCCGCRYPLLLPLRDVDNLLVERVKEMNRTMKAGRGGGVSVPSIDDIIEQRRNRLKTKKKAATKRRYQKKWLKKKTCICATMKDLREQKVFLCLTIELNGLS